MQNPQEEVTKELTETVAHELVMGPSGAEAGYKLTDTLTNIANLAKVSIEADAIPDEAKYHKTLGFSAYTSQEYSDAIYEYSVAISKAPNYIDAHFFRAKCFMEMKQFDKADKDYSRMLEIDPARVELKYDRSIARYKLGAYESALKDITTAIEWAGKDPATKTILSLYYFHQGCIHKKLGDYKAAITDFLHALELEYYDKYPIYLNCAEARISLQQYEKAINDCNFAMEFMDTNRWDAKIRLARIHCNLGIAQRELRQYDQAMDNFNKALKVCPDDAVTMVNRGLLHFNLSELEDACENFKTALSLNPNPTKILYLDTATYNTAYLTLGLTYVYLKIFDEARKVFEKLVTKGKKVAYPYLLDPNQPIQSPNNVHRYTLVAYKSIQSNPNEAREIITNGLALSRDSVTSDKDLQTEKGADEQSNSSAWLHAMLLQAQGLVDKYEGKGAEAKHNFQLAESSIPMGLERVLLYIYRAKVLYHWENYPAAQAVVELIQSVISKNPYAPRLPSKNSAHEQIESDQGNSANPSPTTSAQQLGTFSIYQTEPKSKTSNSDYEPPRPN